MRGSAGPSRTDAFGDIHCWQCLGIPCWQCWLIPRDGLAHPSGGQPPMWGPAAWAALLG